MIIFHYYFWFQAKLITCSSVISLYLIWGLKQYIFSIFSSVSDSKIVYDIPDLSITNIYSPLAVEVGESSSLGKKFTINMSSFIRLSEIK